MAPSTTVATAAPPAWRASTADAAQRRGGRVQTGQVRSAPATAARRVTATPTTTLPPVSIGGSAPRCPHPASSPTSGRRRRWRAGRPVMASVRAAGAGAQEVEPVVGDGEPGLSGHPGQRGRQVLLEGGGDGAV